MSKDGVFSIFKAKPNEGPHYKKCLAEKLVGYLGVALFIPISWYSPTQTHPWTRLIAMMFFPSWIFAFILAGLFGHRAKEVRTKVLAGITSTYCLLMAIVVVLWEEVSIVKYENHLAFCIGLTFMLVVFLAFEILIRAYPVREGGAGGHDLDNASRSS
jgi:peptidoglycan/LPS O-acetylase OafA/YrhL